MEEHHRAWLEKHGAEPEWLSNALNNGFDIHHIDGDHDNNEPSNLVLIYCADHMSLHGGGLKRLVLSGRKWIDRDEYEAKAISEGKEIYERREAGEPWVSISVDFKNAANKAEKYAKFTGLCYPPRSDSMNPETKASRRAKNYASKRRKEEKKQEMAVLGAKMYQERVDGEAWAILEEKHPGAQQLAKKFANVSKLPWPVKPEKEKRVIFDVMSVVMEIRREKKGKYTGVTYI